MLEALINRRAPLNVGIVDILPKNHYYKDICKRTLTNILRFSPLLQVTEDKHDIVFTFSGNQPSSCRLDIQWHRENQEIFSQPIRIRVPQKTVKTANKHLEIYTFSCRILRLYKDAFTSFAEYKYLQKNSITDIAYTFKVVNEIGSEHPLSFIAQGYEASLTNVLEAMEEEIPVAGSHTGEICLQVVGAPETPHENLLIVATKKLPAGLYHRLHVEVIDTALVTHAVLPEIVKENKEHILEEIKLSMAQDLRYELTSLDLTSDRFKEDTKHITTVKDWEMWLSLTHLMTWTQEIIDFQDVPVFSDEIFTQPYEEIPLFALPTDWTIPLLISPYTGKQVKNKQFVEELREVCGAKTAEDLMGGNVRAEVHTDQYGLRIEFTYQGMGIGKALITSEVLQKEAPERKDIFNNLYQDVIRRLLEPVLIYTLSPLGSA